MEVIYINIILCLKGFCPPFLNIRRKYFWVGRYTIKYISSILVLESGKN